MPSEPQSRSRNQTQRLEHLVQKFAEERNTSACSDSNLDSDGDVDACEFEMTKFVHAANWDPKKLSLGSVLDVNCRNIVVYSVRKKIEKNINSHARS